MICSLDNTRWY